MSGTWTGGWPRGRRRGTSSSARHGDRPAPAREAREGRAGRADMRRLWSWALTGLAPWLSPGAAAAQERGYGWGWGMHPMWGVWGLGIGLMMLLFWGVVIVGS